MELNLDPNRLLSDELSYELLLRNISTSGPVASKRSQLRECLRAERKGESSLANTLPLDPKSELKVCDKKVQDIGSMLDTFDVNNYQNEYTRIGTRLAHVTHRVSRILAAEESQIAQKDELTHTCKRHALSLQLKFAAKASAHLAEQHEQSLLEPEEPEAQDLPSATSSPTRNPIPDTESRVADALEIISRTVANSNQRCGTAHPYPVYKWGVTFDGETGLSNFLERVEELRSARGITKVQLYQSAIDLFTGTALNWFRSKRETIHDWDTLVTALRNAFLPRDYDINLWDEIRSRTQGSEEPVTIYIANMEGLFSRLPTRPAPEERIKYIRRNLQSYLQEGLGITCVQTVDELDRTCSLLEGIHLRTQQLKPPPTVNQSLEPDLAYRRPRTSRIATLDTTDESVDVAAVIPTPRAPSSCWNCRQTGHRANECTAPRTRYCYRCGRQNVTVRECPRCSGNGPARS